MRRRSSTGSAPVTSSPSRKMRPLVGSISRLIIFSVVVLPHPDGPTSTQISPSPTSRSRASTATWPLSHRLVSDSRRIKSRLRAVVCPAVPDPWVRWDWVGITATTSSPPPASTWSSRSRRRPRPAHLLPARPGRPAVAAGRRRRSSAFTGVALHHPVAGPLRPARPVHRAVPDDGRDRPGRLHAADPGPQHRRRPRRRARRRPGGGPGHGVTGRSASCCGSSCPWPCP